MESSMPHNLTAGIESEWPLMLRMSKVFADPLRVKILTECQERPMSPRAFYAEFGGVSLDRVSRAFDVLAEYDWIAPVEVGAATGEDGAAEHLYQAIDRMTFEDEVMLEASGPMRSLVSRRIFESLSERVKDAIDLGTLEARVDQHFSWTPLTLDQLGWETVISKVNALFYSLAREQQNADARIADSGEKPISMTVALLGFESPA